MSRFGVPGLNGTMKVKFIQFYPIEFLLDRPFDRLNVNFFLRRDKAVGDSFLFCSTGPSDAVNIIFRLLRNVEVDDMADLSDI